MEPMGNKLTLGSRLLAVLAGLWVSVSVASTASDVAASPIQPFEAAYLEAPIIVRGRVADFDPKSGATIEIVDVPKGEATLGTVTLHGTRNFPFLSKSGTSVVVFIKRISDGYAELWRGPTSGGLIWDSPSLLDQIAAAAADPKRCLGSDNARTRLSAAYYLAHSVSREASNEAVVDALTWGLGEAALDANAAAYSGLGALGVDLEKAGSYHPGYKLELKQSYAQRLKAQLSK